MSGNAWQRYSAPSASVEEEENEGNLKTPTLCVCAAAQ